MVGRYYFNSKSYLLTFKEGLPVKTSVWQFLCAARKATAQLRHFQKGVE